MNGTVTLYMNTYFNGVDIPANPGVLEYAVNSVLSEVHFTRMDEDLTYIDLNIPYTSVRDVDYLKLSTSGGDFYYLCIPSSLAQGVTRMNLQIDYLLTLGGVDECTFISGWQERGHIAKGDDVLFGNIVSESWCPSMPIETANMAKVTTQTQTPADLDLVMSNVDLVDLGQQPLDKQKTIEGYNSLDEIKMYLPCINPVPVHSDPSYKDFMVYDFISNQYVGYAIPGSGVYRITDATTKAGLQRLFSCGQLSLQCSYTIPKEWIDSNYGISNGRFYNLKGLHEENSLTNLPFEYTISGYTPKNKKVFATYRNFVIVNLASGDTCSKPVYQLYDGHSANPSILLWSDPCSTGKPYARFKWIKDNPLQYVDCVHGMQWANHQILLEGASGSMWNSINAAMTNRQLELGQEQALYNYGVSQRMNSLTAEGIGVGIKQTNYGAMVGAVGDAWDAFTGMLGAAGTKTSKGWQAGKPGDIAMAGGSGAFGAVGRAVDLHFTNQMTTIDMKKLEAQGAAEEANYKFAKQANDLAINRNGIDLLKNNQVVAPTAMFTPEQNLGLYGYNYFVVYETRKSVEDLKSEDDYYQRYGYSGLHRPLTNQCFKERTHFTYVQAFDINMRGKYNFGMRMILGAINQLNNGVRVWRELPNAEAYETN